MDVIQTGERNQQRWELKLGIEICVVHKSRLTTTQPNGFGQITVLSNIETNKFQNDPPHPHHDLCGCFNWDHSCMDNVRTLQNHASPVTWFGLQSCKKKHKLFSSSDPQQVTFVWHIFWHSIWHSIWYIFGDYFWLRSSGEHSDPELAVRVRRRKLRSSTCSWGPAEEKEKEEEKEKKKEAGQLTWNLTTLTWQVGKTYTLMIVGISGRHLSGISMDIQWRFTKTSSDQTSVRNSQDTIGSTIADLALHLGDGWWWDNKRWTTKKWWDLR